MEWVIRGIGLFYVASGALLDVIPQAHIEEVSA